MPTLAPYLAQVKPDGTIDGVKAKPADFGAQTGEALTNLGGAAGQTANAVNEVEEQKARMRTAASLTQIDLSARQQFQQMQVDPEFTQKYGEDGSGFAEAFKTQFEDTANQAIQDTDPRGRKYMEQGLYNVGQSVYGAALDFQAKAGAAFAVNTVKTAVDNARQSANIAPDQYTSIMANANMVIDQAKVDPETRMKLRDAAAQDVTLGAALGQLKAGGPQAAQQLLDNKMTFVTVGPDGKPSRVGVRDIVDEKTYGTLTEQADRVIKEAAATQKQAVEAKASDLQTAMEFAESPDDFVNISKSIEDGAGQFGDIKTNELRVMLHKKEKGILEDVESTARGGLYASGSSPLNPDDSKGVKDFNNYYNKVLEPTLANMPDDERNTRLTDLVSKTKVVPENLKGQLHSQALSTDPKQVAQGADFVSRLDQVNPYLTNSLPAADVARLRMSSTMAAAGVPQTEVNKAVDASLNPGKSAVLQDREAQLRTAKVPYAANAMGNFAGYFSGPDVTASEGKDANSAQAYQQNAQLAADYKTAYDAHFKLTGNADEAKNFADTSVRANYALTNINGGTQLMKYAPEHAYGIPGMDNAWMKDQFQAKVKALGYDPAKAYLVPDAFTAQTYGSTPGYKIMAKQPDGSFIDATGSGHHFFFNRSAAGQSNVDRANAPLDERIQREMKAAADGG